MKAILALLFCGVCVAQAPPVPVTGGLGAGGSFPVISSPAVVFGADANHTMTYPEMAGSSGVMVVTSAVSLTAQRDLVAPLAKGFEWAVKNATTGGQSIQVIGSSGTGAVIPNGATALVLCDGANYLSVGSVLPPAGVPNSTGTGYGASYAVGTSANNLVQLTSSAALPAVSGTNLTSLNGANLQAGTVANAALSNSGITVNSVSCVLGSSCSVTASTSRVLFGSGQITGAGTFFVAYGTLSALLETTLSSQLMPASGVAANLYVGMSADPGAGVTVQVTLRVNGSVTGVGCTITGNGSTNKGCNDTTHTATIAQGAQADFQVTSSTGVSGTPFISVATTY